MPKKVLSPSRGEQVSNDYVPKISYKVPRRYKLSCAVKESHGHPIYCVAFSRHMHVVEDEGSSNNTAAACFATCAGPYATIYEVALSTSINDKESNSDSNSESNSNHNIPVPLTARQIYKDVDDGETFYTCAFGGRGVGSPVGYSVAEERTNSKNQTNNIIYFGEDKKRNDPQHEQKNHNDSKKPAKRQKKSDEEHDSTGKLHTNPSSQLSNTQNGPPLLCLGGTSGVIKVIDVIRRSLVMTLSGHGNDLTDLKFSPANEWLLLSSSKDESIRLWNLQRGVNVAVFTGHNGHRGQVLSVSWHLSGTKFASCGMDNTVKLWKVYDNNNGYSNENKEHGPVEMALRKSLNVLPYGCCKGEVCQTSNFDTIFQQFPYFSTNKAHTNYVDCVQFVGDLILSKSTDNKVVLWKPLFDNEEETERPIYNTHRVPSSILFLREFNLDHCGSWYIRFDSPSPHHQLLALGNEVGEVKVWHVSGNDNKNGTADQKYFSNLSTSGFFNNGGSALNEQSTVRMVAFNPHGSHLVAVKDDSTVWVWVWDAA